MSTDSLERRHAWDIVIGLELHAQLRSTLKLFSDASALFDAEPNKHVALFDLAYPGTLPVLSEACLGLAIRAALALNCKIRPSCSFDRKHYYYRDLPLGYQITQHFGNYMRQPFS